MPHITRGAGAEAAEVAGRPRPRNVPRSRPPAPPPTPPPLFLGPRADVLLGLRDRAGELDLVMDDQLVRLDWPLAPLAVMGLLLLTCVGVGWGGGGRGGTECMRGIHFG